jgi:uncharacterized protein YgiB involved in biofilm formation
MTRVSRAVLALAAVACSSLVSGCDDDKTSSNAGQASPPGAAQEGRIYKTLDACLAEAADMDAVNACRQGYHDALAKMADAPRFDQQARCEDVYGPGNCVPRGSVVHDGSGGFIPFMFGYMLGGFGGRTNYVPVYVDRGGSTYAGSTVIANPSWSGGVPSATSMASKGGPSLSATTSSSVARGGFGGTAMARAGVSSLGG